MLNNSENISQNTEASQSNDWDMSDVADFSLPEKPAEDTEKSEEEREYERKERSLQDELFHIVDRRADSVNGAGEELYAVMKNAEHRQAEDMHDAFSDLSYGKKFTDHAYLESYFNYVNEMFPSPFSKKERDMVRTANAEDDFRRSAVRGASVMDENVDGIAKIFSSDGSKNDLEIAAKIRNLGKSSGDFSVGLASAIIGYCEDPSAENKKRIINLQADHERAITNSLFTVAEVFDRSKTEVGKHMFEPTSALAGQVARNSEEYYEGVMDYLKFKMNASKPLENH